MVCVNISKRFTVFLMLCLVSIINNIARGHMSIVILAMAKITAVDVPDYGPRYEWSTYDRSLVIGSFFWGQVLVITFAGILAERYGPRKITGIGIVTAALLFILAPVSANYLWLLISVNFTTGIMIGTIPPAMQALIARWAPPEEKGKFLSAIMANGFGIVINWTLSGFIIKHFGWHYAFYMVGGLLGTYAIAWFYLVYDSPNKHPTITVEEKEFIMSKLNTTSTKAKKPWPPFRSILMSVPFWALVFHHFGNLFATFLFMTAAPSYLSEVHTRFYRLLSRLYEKHGCMQVESGLNNLNLRIFAVIIGYFYSWLPNVPQNLLTVHHFSISTTGVLSSIPYVVRFPFAIAFGFTTDYILKKKILKPTAIRKGFTTFSHLIPACCLIGITFVGSSAYLCVALITLALGLSSAIAVTSDQNTYDLSPNFSTTVYGFMHTIGLTTGFIAPMVVAHFTKERNSEDEWNYIFSIGAGILTCTAIIFILFGSGEVQKWNKINEDVTEDKETQSFMLSPKVE